MDSPRSGSLKESVELLRIETDLFDLYIQGKPFHPRVESLHLHREDDGDWVHATLDIIETPNRFAHIKKLVFSTRTGELVEWNRADVLPTFYEYQDYTLVLQKHSNLPIEFYHENMHLRRAIKQVGRDGKLLSGLLNFQNEVGYTDFEIRIAGATVLQVRFEIFPSKINYKTDYQQILQEVNSEVYNLAFDFMRKTYNLAGQRSSRNPSLTEFWAILQAYFDQLVKSVDRMQANPHHRLQNENRMAVADKVKRPGKENLSFLNKRPHLLMENHEHGVIQAKGKQYQPTKLIETKRRIDYDTAENRFVKWALQKIATRLKELRIKLKEWKGDSKDGSDSLQLQTRLQPIERMQEQVKRLLRADFLQEVSEMRQLSISLVLLMAPGYREVYRIYLLLTKGLALQSDLFRLSLKDVAQLYEYWCFLKIHHLLKNKYQLVKQDILRVNRNGLFVTLDKSRNASVTYKNPETGEKFTLLYNSLPYLGRKRGEKVPTVVQRPDNVFTIKKQNSSVDYHYIFDAKYRLNPAQAGSRYQEIYELPGPEEDDINTMHRYRDAIVYQDEATHTYERSMFGAYVLFPYHDEEEFFQHHFYKSIKKVNVGALPFLPNSTRLVEEFLDELIRDTPDQAVERSLQQRGEE